MMLDGGRGHLTYCSNIHPGETWAEVRAQPRALRAVGARSGRARPAVRHRPAPVGAGGAARLSRARGARRVQGFPGARASLRLHPQRLSLRHLPRHAREGRGLPARLARRRAAALHRPARRPAGRAAAGRAWTRRQRQHRARRVQAERAHARGRRSASPSIMVRHVAHLVQLQARTGKHIALALEPEPCCFLETIDESVAFFRDLSVRGRRRHAG